MKTIKVLAFTAMLAWGQAVWADDASKAEAEALLAVMGMDKVLDESMTQMLEMQVQQNPSLEPYKAIMAEFLAKHMSYESMKPEIVEVYAEAFTAQELKEITAFYKTPTGQKTIETMPVLMQKGAQMAMARVQQNLPELQNKIEAESARRESAEEAQ
jgi:hypothetical protein